ncbi:MAG: metalloregulator ArsR/SmtB family transcription factor [Myxococcota bacterium]
MRAAAGQKRATTQVLALFRAFSHADRLTVLLALSEHESLCVSELTELCGATQSAMSHQLRRLREAGLVRARRRGKQIFYALDDQHVAAILEDALSHAREKRPSKSGRG